MGQRKQHRSTGPPERREAARDTGVITIRPLEAERWSDVERLFGPRGACAGCWCMFWRQSQADYQRLRGSGNKRAFKKLVIGGERPGVIAYSGKEPVGWCAVAPRERYKRLERSRVLAPIDGARVWSIVCFFVARPFRRRGVTRQLIDGAMTLAKKQGARTVEGYPVEPKMGRGMADVFAYTGVASAFRKAGFREALRRSPTRPIMRRDTISGGA